MTILSKVTNGAQTALMLEGRDPITLLWYRIAWHISVKDDRVVSMWECSQILGSQR